MLSAKSSRTLCENFKCLSYGNFQFHNFRSNSGANRSELPRRSAAAPGVAVSCRGFLLAEKARVVLNANKTPFECKRGFFALQSRLVCNVLLLSCILASCSLRSNNAIVGLERKPMIFFIPQILAAKRATYFTPFTPLSAPVGTSVWRKTFCHARCRETCRGSREARFY